MGHPRKNGKPRNLGSEFRATCFIMASPTVLWFFGREGEALGPQEARFAYSGLLSLLRKRGLKKSPSQTPMEFAGSIESAPVRGAVREFTELYNASRFGEAGVSIAKFRELKGKVRAALSGSRKMPARRSVTVHLGSLNLPWLM